MATAKVFNQENLEVGDISLPDEIFQTEVRPEILHMVVRAHLAALRAGTVGVKTRSLASGGGKKPWRQKGTGRARSGSSRSPIWRGGAVVHGPVARDYSFKVNKKVKKLAMKMALTARFVENKMTVIDDFELPEIKTKNFVALQNRFGLKKALIITKGDCKNLSLSARNVQGIEIKTQDKVSTYDILSQPHLVIESGAIDLMQERLK